MSLSRIDVTLISAIRKDKSAANSARVKDVAMTHHDISYSI